MEEKKRLSPKRLVIDIPEEWHSQIKALSAIHNINLRKYVLRVVMKQVKEDLKLLGKEL